MATTPAFCQKKGKSKEQLQKEITTLQNDIETANKLLKKTSNDRQMTLNEVSILDKKIQQREQLIEAYKEQLALLDTDINSGQSHIRQLNSDLEKLRKEYAEMISFAYKTRSSYDRLAFIFASKDFNQAISRMRYIQEFSDARKVKINQISSTEKRLSGEVEASQKARAEQAALLEEEQKQQEALQQEKKQLETQVANLKKQEGKIQKDIKSKQQQAQKLQKSIDDIIAEEIRLANEKRKKEEEKNKTNTNTNTSTTTGKTSMALTPAEQTLSTNFANNKGKLPWPVERGVISSTYGKHTSVVSSKVTMTNNGIDIATTEGAQARAVFEGEVTAVNKIMESNTVVIIRHGQYFTVYSNLENVTVKRGDKVTTKQNIGQIHTNKTENQTELHFEVLKENTRQDPAGWLSK